MSQRAEIARDIAERLERAWSSEHAAGLKRPAAPTRGEQPQACRPDLPPSSAEHARLARRARDLHPWMTDEQVRVTADAWSRMVPAPPGTRTRRRKAKPPKPDIAPEPRNDGSRLWWRTVSDRVTRCRQCNTRIASGDRYLYRHQGREVRCRDCSADQWDDARPSKALRKLAERRRLEQLDRLAA